MEIDEVLKEILTDLLPKIASRDPSVPEALYGELELWVSDQEISDLAKAYSEPIGIGNGYFPYEVNISALNRFFSALAHCAHVLLLLEYICGTGLLATIPIDLQDKRITHLQPKES
jgi:hypothetical protein